MLTLRLSCNRRHGTHLFAIALLGPLALLSNFTGGKAHAQDLDLRSTSTNSARTAVATNNHGQSKAIVRSSETEHGATLAHVVCQSCHLFPEPSLLDKATWESEALPFMSKWLGSFAYHVDMNVLVYLGAALLAIAIALVTVSTQTIKAAMTNPAKTLRYE